MNNPYIRRGFILVILAGAFLATTAMGAAGLRVDSVSEGQDPESGRPVLLLTGKSLKKVSAVTLLDPSGPTQLDAPTIVSKKSDRLLLLLPDVMGPGRYDLTLQDKKGNSSVVSVLVSNGQVLPGAVGQEAISSELLADLGDADTLQGFPAGHFLDASNLNEGTLGTGFFSAYGDLVAEGKLGSGPTQVALGDHDHDGVYVKPADLESLATKAELADYATTTDLEGFAPADHDHDEVYAKKAMVGARVRRSGSLAVSGGSAAIIPFNAEDYDTDSFHDDVNQERLTAPRDGYYLVQASVSFAMINNFQIQFRQNGSQVAKDDHHWDANHPGTATMTRVLALVQGDYVEVRVSRINDSNPYSVQGNADDDAATTFSMHLLGE